MAAIIATAQNYWISTSALTITLNALGEANRVQASVASGAQIMCYIRGVDGLDFDEGHNYRRWPLTVSPTFFNTNTHKYLYVVIPRTTAIGTQAMVWFPSQLLDINGCAIDEEGEPAEQVGNPDYYYIWLQGIISSSGASGNTPRTWEQQPQTGTLATDEAVSPTGGFWYQWDAISQTVTFLKDIWMDAASTFRNLILGGKTLTGVAVDDTTPDDSTTHVATPAYIKSISNDRYLRKDQDDFTPFSLGIGTNLNVDGEVIADWMQSSEYTGDGMMDKGYKLWYDATTGRSKLVIDDLVARGKFTVNELESRIWTYAGGNMIFSGAGSTIFFVEYLDANDNLLGYTHINAPWLLNGRPLLSAMVAWSKRRKVMRSLTPAERARVAKFRCYEYSDNGTMQTRNWWHTDDLAFCQTLNHVKDKVNSDGSYSGSLSNTVYHRLVKKIGTAQIEALDDGQFYDYVELSNISGEYDPTYNDWPAAGDVIVQRGNRTDSSRRSMVTIEVTGDTRGLKVYDNIMGWYADTAHGEHPNGVRYTYIGYNESTGRANLEAFGDAYIGSIDKQTTYVKFDEQQQKLDIKARISAQSTMPRNGSDVTFENIFNGINQQIDGKVETWRQATDPALNWSTDTERLKHVGDLWMDISANGGKKTYIYQDNGTSANPRFVWDQQDVPQAVFDGIDGKAAIYGAWGAWVIGGVNKLHVRDMLVPDATFTHDSVQYKQGKVYRCDSVDPIAFSEVRYTDDTTFHNYIGALLGRTWQSSADDTAAANAQKVVIGALNADTVIDGGLMLTSLIALRQLRSPELDPTVPGNYDTWGGISGIYNTNMKGNGIAAWWGGDMVDKQNVQQLPASYAKILFRMDGSGYVADGGLSWDYNNQGKTVVTLNGDVVKAANYYLNGTDITQELQNLFDMFEKVNVAAEGQTPYYMIHAKLGIYADGDLQALGYSPSQGGGGGGASVLYELNDVWPDSTTTPTKVKDAQPGYVLTYGDDNHWYAAPAAQTYVLPQATAQALGGIKIGYTTDSTNKKYAVELDDDGKAFVTVPWASVQQATSVTLGGIKIGYAPAQGENRNYAVALDSNGKAYVNVPWTDTDTTYSAGNGISFDGTTINNSGVRSVTLTNDNKLRVNTNGTNNDLTIPYATSAGSAGSASIANIANKVYCTSHIGSWWLSEDWDNTYFWITAKYENSTLPCAVSNADKCDGLHVHTDRNNEANKIVRTDGNGYIQCGYINSSSGDEGNNSSPSRVWGTNGSDSYLRTYLTSALSVGWASGAGYISSDGIDLIAHNNNEINFGGANTDTTIYFGYRSRGSRPAPTSYVFGKDSAASIYCNYLYAASDVQVTSDERRKDVIGDVQLSVEQIAKMPSVLFRWKKGFGDDLIHVGTIAQSWEKVLPAAVGIGTDDDRTRSFSYSAAAYAMAHADACEIVALKKEKADSVEVKALKEEVSTLKEEVRELREELKRFKSA